MARVSSLSRSLRVAARTGAMSSVSTNLIDATSNAIHLCWLSNGQILGRDALSDLYFCVENRPISHVRHYCQGYCCCLRTPQRSRSFYISALLRRSCSKAKGYGSTVTCTLSSVSSFMGNWLLANEARSC